MELIILTLAFFAIIGVVDYLLNMLSRALENTPKDVLQVN